MTAMLKSRFLVVESLLACVAVLAILGSVARADFVISSTRQQNAFTLNSQTYDIITYTLTNNGLHGTGTTTNNIDVAMYDATNGGKNGMLISAGGIQAGYPDLFAQGGEASLPHTSWMNGNLHSAGVTIGLGGSSVAVMNGSTFTFDQSNNNTDLFANTYTDQQLVAGLAGVQFWTAALWAPDASRGAVFAQATVQHGDVVVLVLPTANGRTAPSTSWETGGTAFGVTGTSTILPNADGTYSEPLPDPSSITLIGLFVVGLLSRHRRSLLQSSSVAT